MDKQEMIFVLHTIRKDCGLCRTEKEVIDQVIEMLENDPYLKALADVEHIIKNQICSVSHGKFLIVEDGIWVNGMDVLRNDHEE